MTATILQTLAERGKAYGSYQQQAATAQNLKAVMHSAPNWLHLNSAQRESLDMAATKISRILHGDPMQVDSWHDLQGYAALAELTLISSPRA